MSSYATNAKKNFRCTHVYGEMQKVTLKTVKIMNGNITYSTPRQYQRAA